MNLVHELIRECITKSQLRTASQEATLLLLSDYEQTVATWKRTQNYLDEALSLVRLAEHEEVTEEWRARAAYLLSSCVGKP